MHIVRENCQAFRKSFKRKIVYWALKALGVPKVPSDSMTKLIFESLQYYCGICSYQFEGAFGHVYYANDLCAIIAQVHLFLYGSIEPKFYYKEMANPMVPVT